MDFVRKDSANQTTESFTHRVPLGQKNSKNLPFVSQIQQLMSLLVQKKAQLKEAKLRQDNLFGKTEQQEVRISKIKIAMEHEIEKEQMIRGQQQRLQQQINTCKQSIKDLTRCVKTAKAELGEVLEDIIAGKKNKHEIDGICAQLECLIQNKTLENAKLDEQIQNLQTLIISSQNDVRSRQDELTSLQLEKAELINNLDYLEQTLKRAVRAKNSGIAENKDLAQKIVRTEQKLHNIKKETQEMEWGCQQIRAQNIKIQGCNQQLVSDLEGVRKHLATMQKMNQLLQNSLSQYGFTGDKVTRMINATRTY